MTKAMATGQMWTQAQPAERACRGAAAAERRLNGVAYTAPKSRLPKKLRGSYDTYRVDNDLGLVGALRAQIRFAGRAPRAAVAVKRHHATLPTGSCSRSLAYLGSMMLSDTKVTYQKPQKVCFGSVEHDAVRLRCH